ncbi:MAG TPA: hypothetical protein VJ728_06275, partial [Candidatus Binataceae bacterium]|nr:hypothetical protein [Candidatus Binataceae bacterium]
SRPDCRRSALSRLERPELGQKFEAVTTVLRLGEPVRRFVGPRGNVTSLTTQDSPQAIPSLADLCFL